MGGGTRFARTFSGQCYMVFLPFSLLRFERSLHSAQVSGQIIILLPLTIETDDITSGRKNVDVHGHYEQLRGKWVNNFILATKLTELKLG